MAINFPEGTQSFPSNIIQVQSTRYSGVFSATGGFATVTGLNCSITPKSTSNKIFVMLHVGGGYYDSNTMVYRLLRGSTQFYRGDADGNRPRVSHRTDGRKSGDSNHIFGVFIHAIDDPSTTSQVTYKVEITGEGQNKQMYINREKDSSNTSDPAQARTVSTMTLMEFAP